MTKEIEKLIQVSGFGVNNTNQTQCDYMLVGLTNTGRVVLSMGDRDWVDVSPIPRTINEDAKND